MLKPKDRLRRQARRKYFVRLYAAQNGLCHWCKSYCAILSNIPQEQVVSIKNWRVTWRDGDDCLVGRIASVDHVQEIRNGGKNEGNIVMACTLCNCRRSAMRSPTEALDKVCRDCQGPKQPKQTRCHACRLKHDAEWLKRIGWEEVPKTGGHVKYQDPLNGELHIIRFACAIAGKRQNAERGVTR